MKPTRKAITDPSKAVSWLKKSAAHYLGAHASSEANLRQVLMRRAARRMPESDESEISGIVDEVVEFCRQYGFVDDEAYSATKVAVGARRGLSRSRLLASLSAKGVERKVISDAISEVDDESGAVRFAKRKRLGPFRTREIENALERDIAAFARGGFPIDIARRTSSMSLDDAENILYGTSV